MEGVIMKAKVQKIILTLSIGLFMVSCEDFLKETNKKWIKCGSFFYNKNRN